MTNPSRLNDVYKKLMFGVKTKTHSKDTDNNQSKSKLLLRKLDEVSNTPGCSANRDDNSINVLEENGGGIKILDSCQVEEKLEHFNSAEKTMQLKKEKMNHIRKLNRIYTWGSDIPDLLINFDDLPSMNETLLENINMLGIKEPTPIQMQAVPVLLQKRDLLACAPTGSGKTLAFAVPIILEVLRLKSKPKYSTNSKLLAVVVEPTRDLARQIYVEFLKFCENLAVTCSLMESDQLPKNAEVMITTPNRLAHYCQNNSNRAFRLLRWLIVDESDRLFDTTEGDGRCFRSQLATIYQACLGKFVRRGFFSATFSSEVEEWCKVNLIDVAMVCVGARNSTADSVKQELVFTGSEHGKIVALRSLFREGLTPPAIIFVQSKDRARQLCSELKGFEPPVPFALISSERSEKDREQSLANFRTGKVWVLICTELLSRGLDLRGVNVVINFDLPTSVISYIHRIGRTGRAGRSGRAITYFTEQDLNIIRPIATVINQAGCEVPEYTLRMKKLTRNVKKDLLRRAPKRKNVGRVKRKRKSEDTLENEMKKPARKK